LFKLQNTSNEDAQFHQAWAEQQFKTSRPTRVIYGLIFSWIRHTELVQSISEEPMFIVIFFVMSTFFKQSRSFDVCWSMVHYSGSSMHFLNWATRTGHFAFVAEIFLCTYKLNMGLQGEDQSVHNLYTSVKPLKSKLAVFSRQISNKSFASFSHPNHSESGRRKLKEI